MSNRSVVMLASTDLLSARKPDSTVQVTLTDDGDVFLSVSADYGNVRVYVRIPADEWNRKRLQGALPESAEWEAQS